MDAAAEQSNQRMVDFLIAEGALWSPALIAAFRATPRHRFLDRVYQFQARQNRWREIITRNPDAQELRLLYADRALITHLSPPRPGRAPVPISSSSQPSLMAQMLEDLQLAPGLRVLEIGAGTGYNAALLAHVVGPDRVISVDVDRNVLSEAWDHLRGFPDRRVQLQHGDGRQGWPEAAPYDRIMVTAATPTLEPAWLAQLAENGILSIPLALAPGLAFILCGTVRDGLFCGRLKRAAYFMPLRAEGEAGDEEETATLAAGAVALPAPWAELFDQRRSRGCWLRFVQSLVLYGLLRGLTVHYRSRPDDLPAYRVADEAGHWCWYSPAQWHVSGREGRQLGETLWRAWLDLGGPWPTEYEIRTGPRLDLASERDAALSAGSPRFVRHDAAGPQVWQLVGRRVRGNWL